VKYQDRFFVLGNAHDDMQEALDEAIHAVETIRDQMRGALPEGWSW
jgi:hypothetical protein